MDHKIAYFGAGCFWHSELIFSKVPGVLDTEVGYGQAPQTNGEIVSSVEVVKVSYDPSLVDYETLIDTFWTTHNPANPSNKNMQNIERSTLFTLNDTQNKVAKRTLEKKASYQEVYTSIVELSDYRKAPEKDQKYYFKS